MSTQLNNKAPALNKLKKLMTEQEVSELLGIQPQSLRAWRHKGIHLNFRKIGGAVRYHPDDIEAYIHQSTRSSTSDMGDL